MQHRLEINFAINYLRVLLSVIDSTSCVRCLRCYYCVNCVERTASATGEVRASGTELRCRMRCGSSRRLSMKTPLARTWCHGSLVRKTAARSPNIYRCIRNTKLCTRKRAILKFAAAARAVFHVVLGASSRVTGRHWTVYCDRAICRALQNCFVLILAILLSHFTFVTTYLEFLCQRDYLGNTYFYIIRVTKWN